MKDFVMTDNPVVGSILRKIVSIVVDGGAELHPSLRLIEKDGAMALHCGALPSMVGEEQKSGSLVRMPRELLLPTAGALWEDRADRLVLSKAPECLSPVQQELLELHIALYNAAGKLPWMVRHHPHRLLQEQPALLEAVRRLRPQTSIDNSSLADVFVSTRQCLIDAPPTNAAPQDEAEESELGEWAIFPVLDITNNHHGGARFERSDAAVSMAVAQTGGSSECFLRYGGRRDVLDLALGLGYLDGSTPFAHSAPVQVSVDGLGTLEVEALRTKPAHPLDPPRVQFTEQAMVLSHLTCHQREPQRARVALTLAAQGAAQRAGCPASVVKGAGVRVMQELARANIRLLEGMQRDAEPLACRWPSARLLIEAARRQAGIMNEVMIPLSG